MNRSIAVCVALMGAWFALGPTPAAEAGLSGYQETALYMLARGESWLWEELSGEQSAELYARAEAYLSDYPLYHAPHGQAVSVLWVSKERTAALSYETCGDGATWTGHYLAALACRWSVTKDAETLDAILGVLDTFDLLTTVTGRSGYIARYAGPADDPAYRAYYENYRWGAFPGAPPFDDQIWLGWSSRDIYDGVNFGLVTTWLLVEEPVVRDRVQRLVNRITDRLLADGGWIVDGQGHFTNWTPWWALSMLRTALSVSPTRYQDQQDTYDALYLLAAALPPHTRGRWKDDYYTYNLDYLRLFGLCLLETQGVKRAYFKGVMRDMYKDGARDHLNAHFAALYMAATGDITLGDGRAALQGMLLDFPDPPNWDSWTDQRLNPLYFPHHDADLSEFAIHRTQDRVPTEFAWQRSPCLLWGGLPGQALDFPGIDIFLPYWMGRCIGAIPAP